MKVDNLLFENSEDISDFNQNFHSSHIFHGSSNMKEGYQSTVMRTTSKDTIPCFHHYVNELSLEKFDVAVRNLMFGSFNRSNADEYGVVHTIAPTGTNYRIFTNPHVNDLTMNYSLGTTRFIRMFNEAVLSKFDKGIQMFEINLNSLKKLVSFESLRNYLILLVSKVDIDDNMIEKVHQQVDIFIESLIGQLKDYVKYMIEIKSEDDINKNVKMAELMIYMPDGFIAKKYMVNDI